MQDPDPKVSVLKKELKGTEVITPQVEFVTVISPCEFLKLKVHQGRYAEVVVQLKTAGSFVSVRGKAFEGLVVKPPITLSKNKRTVTHEPTMCQQCDYQ